MAVDQPDPALVAELVAALRVGEPVVIPTDTIYGVAASPAVAGATARLFALKDRPPDTALAVLVADVDQAMRLMDDPTSTQRLADAFWPGPLTLVARRHRDVEWWDLGGDPTTIGLRCPQHALVQAVAAEVGPIATTSANRHGQPTPATATGAAAALVAPVAVIADGGSLTGSASTVVDVTGPELRVLREGPITGEALRAVIGR